MIMNKLIMLSVLAIVLIAGCTTQTPTGNVTGQPQPNVTISHAGYIPSSFSVNMGDTVRFFAVAAQGTSSHNHGITIDAFNVNQAVTTEDTNNPVIIEFVANQRGTFTIYCRTCWDGPFGTNHPAIQGTLTVS